MFSFPISMDEEPEQFKRKTEDVIITMSMYRNLIFTSVNILLEHSNNKPNHTLDLIRFCPAAKNKLITSEAWYKFV